MGMKKTFYLLSFILLCLYTAGQNKASRLFEYLPAPGQYINTTEFGTPKAAENILSFENKSVSLGAFGGYIVLGFDKPCLNDPLNPFGIDFTIFGNAFGGSSEPGIIWVMSDSNGNGKPDDTWYEITGSEHFNPGVKQKTGITYYRTGTRDIKWRCSDNTSGVIKANSYHIQEYYPSPSFFPGYPADSVYFTSTLLVTETEIAADGALHTLPPAFGYADNHARKVGSGPDNPYTEIVAEGNGGDPVDISWAMDASGRYIDLPSVNFVKISTGNLSSSGFLGEMSSEISAIVDVDPVAGTQGNENLVVVYSLPGKILKGDSVQINAACFLKGRFTGKQVVCSVSDGMIATVSPGGMLKTIKTGKFELSVTSKDNPSNRTVRSIEVIEPKQIEILNDFTSFFPGDTIPLRIRCTDNAGNEISTIGYDLKISQPTIAKILNNNNQFSIVALKPGFTDLSIGLTGSSVSVTVRVIVSEPSTSLKVYLTIKDESRNLLPLQWISVPITSLNGYVDNRKGDYNTFEKPTLAHVIASGLQKAVAGFRFRENDPTGGGVYLYSVEKDGIYTYGWGGKTEPAAYARAWLVRRNGKQVYSNLEKITVKQNDTIVVYNSGNLLKDWELSMLIPSAEVVKAETAVSINAFRILCRWSESSVYESISAKIPDLDILFETENKKTILTTNDEGMVSYMPENSGTVTVTQGNNAVLLKSATLSYAAPIQRHILKVFPNPVSRQLNVTGTFPAGSNWKITGLYGEEIINGCISGNQFVIPVGSIPEGIYFLHVRDKETCETVKFIKQ